MQVMDVNGARLRYEYRPRGAPTIVLLHEMGGSLESYEQLLPMLAERWSVLRYDQRGAGFSDRIVGPLAIDTPASDLEALLDALSLTKPVVLVGAAVGAAVAIRFATRCPQRVAALVLLAPSTGLIAGRLEATIEKIEALEAEGREAASASGEPASAGSANDPASRAATWRMLIGLQLQADLDALACPTLVVAGMHDLDRPPDHVAGVAGKIRGARLVTLDTGHLMALDTPELVAATVVPFLDAVGFR